jgi:hypothetical protein
VWCFVICKRFFNNIRMSLSDDIDFLQTQLSFTSMFILLVFKSFRYWNWKPLRPICLLGYNIDFFGIFVHWFLVVTVSFELQWNLCNPAPEFSDILWHPTKIYGHQVFLLTKIKPECSDILYNPTHFPDPLVCRIRQVPLYLYFLFFVSVIFT